VGKLKGADEKFSKIIFTHDMNAEDREEHKCQDNLGKLATERQTILDFTEARDDGVAVASAGPYAPHSRQITTPVPITQF